MDSPPVPLPAVKSPPWIMNCLITRWKLEPLKCSGLPSLPMPFSPVHRALKFSAVLGTTSSYSSKVMRPAGFPPMVISKKTRLRAFLASSELMMNLEAHDVWEQRYGRGSRRALERGLAAGPDANNGKSVGTGKQENNWREGHGPERDYAERLEACDLPAWWCCGSAGCGWFWWGCLPALACLLAVTVLVCCRPAANGFLFLGC